MPKCFVVKLYRYCIHKLIAHSRNARTPLRMRTMHAHTPYITHVLREGGDFVAKMFRGEAVPLLYPRALIAHAHGAHTPLRMHTTHTYTSQTRIMFRGEAVPLLYPRALIAHAHTRCTYCIHEHSLRLHTTHIHHCACTHARTPRKYAYISW